MADLKIPEKWQDVYQQCNEFLAHPGVPSTTPIRWCISLIEENAALVSDNFLIASQANRMNDEIIALKSQVERLAAPVSDDEWRIRATYRKNESLFLIGLADLNVLLAARATGAEQKERA